MIGFTKTCTVDIDDPLPVASNSASGNEPSPDQISTLQDMGFSEAQAKKALRETVSDRPPAWVVLIQM